MARIEGVDLPRDKRVEIALTYIYGIGRPTSKKLLDQTGVSPDLRVRDLTEAQLQQLRDAIGGLTTEGDLRRQVQLNIKRLQEIGVEVVQIAGKDHVRFEAADLLHHDIDEEWAIYWRCRRLFQTDAASILELQRGDA